MHHIVFIPGIMGSRLSRPKEDQSLEEVWPPTVWEVIRGYDRLDALVDPRVRSTAVIEKQCETFYGPLLDAIRATGATEDGTKNRLIPWHYDWRKDLTTHSQKLASDLAAICTSDANARISVVAHSMGGLVTRGCLEDPQSAGAPWLGRVGLALFLATPHNGAPLALSRILGIGGSSLGLSQQQLRELSNHPDYPSAYQLLPPEAGELVWRLDGLLPFSGQSIRQLVGDPAQGLSFANLERATAFRQRLDPSRRHANTRYFSVASATHATTTRFDAKDEQLLGVAPKSSGDGTVPVQSGAALDVQTGYVVADHVGVAKSDEAIDLALMLLELKPPSAVPLMLASLAARPSRIRLSVSPMIPAADENWELVVTFPAGEESFEGSLLIQRSPTEPGKPAQPVEINLVADAPALESLSLEGPRLTPGQYSVVLKRGDVEVDERPLIVSAPLMRNDP